MATVTTVFTTINGMLVHEDRGGTETEYVSDPLGSLVQARNSSGSKTYEAEYWPYGELQSSTGANPSLWGFVGLLGYLADSATVLYVRARYLMTKFARWLTVDPLWPKEFAYLYVRDNSVSIVDPSGREGCEKPKTCDECQSDCLDIPSLLEKQCAAIIVATTAVCTALCFIICGNPVAILACAACAAACALLILGMTLFCIAVVQRLRDICRDAYYRCKYGIKYISTLTGVGN